MMKKTDDLRLHEEFLLLALRDQLGTVESGVNLNFGLGGALLADLLMMERATVEKEGRKSFLKVLDTSASGYPLIDECLLKLKKAKRRAQLVTWVQRFASIPRLKHRAAESLCERGVLGVEEGTILLLFKHKVYPELDGRVEKAVLERLRRAIFTRTREIEPRTVVLVSLADATGLLRVHFDRKMLKAQKKRIAQVTQGEFIGSAAKAAVDAATAVAAAAAAMVVIMSATTAATSS
jgi:hypothetical protein